MQNNVSHQSLKYLVLQSQTGNFLGRMVTFLLILLLIMYKAQWKNK